VLTKEIDPLALLAHDLRSSLGIVLGGLSQLLDPGRKHGPLTPGQREILDLSLRNVRLVEALCGTLASGRLATREMLPARDAAPEQTTVAEVLAAALSAAAAPPGAEDGSGAEETEFESVRERVAEQGVVVEADENVLHAPVRVPRVGLVRALLNLLVNARRHGGGAPVWLEAARVEGGLRFAVEDAGPGLPEDARRFLEAPRLEPPPKRGGRRCLGLMSVRWVLERLGGSIRLEPPRGATGTRIVVEVPLRDDA
jgi:signal transduction histidine kinase